MTNATVIRPITIFTPSVADEDNTNAQNLTVKEIIARLPEDEFQVTMMSLGKPDPRIARRKNTKLVPYTKHGNTLRLLRHCLFPLPDIYFYPRQGPLDQMFFALHRTLRLRTAVVTHIVMVMNDVTARNNVLARSIIESSALFANSAYVADTVQQRFGVKAGTIYNGIDKRFYFPRDNTTANPTGKPLIVFYAGSFQIRKRVELVVQQAARRPDVSFRLAGCGETEPTCRTLAARLACKNVSFLGHLSPIQLGEEMRRADVFIFPSILEGHPQVLGQAAACGLPVIAMNTYHPEYVIHEQTGFLVATETELAQKLDLLLQDSALRKSMATAAVRHSQKFDWDKITEQWIEVFTNLAKKR